MAGVQPDAFNSLFEMMRVIVSDFCGFLSDSVVVLGVCRGVFCVGFVGVVCLCVVAWGLW